MNLPAFEYLIFYSKKIQIHLMAPWLLLNISKIPLLLVVILTGHVLNFLRHVLFVQHDEYIPFKKENFINKLIINIKTIKNSLLDHLVDQIVQSNQQPVYPNHEPQHPYTITYQIQHYKIEKML